MDDSQRHGAEDAEAAAASVWKAGADAWMWAATIREQAAWAEFRMACEANSDADDALGLVTAAGGKAIDAQGMADAAAMGRAADAMRKASALFGRMSEAFERASRLHSAAASDEDRSAMLYERAGNAKYAEFARGRAKKSRTEAASAAGAASGSAKGRAALLEDADMMDEAAKKWAAKGRRWEGNRMALDQAHTVLREDSKRERVRSETMLGRAVEVEQMSEQVQRLAAAAARFMADSTAYRRDDPAVQEAMAAWREALAAANKAEADYAAGRLA